jgi:hypothetical protein
MSFITIPESKVTAFIGSKIGGLQAQLQDKVQAKIQSTISTFVQANACPRQQTLDKLVKSKQTLSDLTERSRKIIDTYKALPRKLRPPINTLDKIIKVLLVLPIPQAVPPGIGLPISISNKYSDLINKLRELVKQTKDTIDGIEALVDTTFFDNLMNDINSKLSLLDGPIAFCSIENELKDSLTPEELDKLGLVDADGNFIISRLVPRLVQETLVDPVRYADGIDDGNNYGSNCFRGLYKPGTIYIHTDERRDIVEGSDGNKYIVNNRAKNGLDTWLDPLTGFDWELYEINTQKLLEDLLNRLSNTSLVNRDLLDNIKTNLNNYKIQTTPVQTGLYRARNGVEFLIEVLDDTTSPSVAKRRFAVARNPQGIIVMKGQPSFASDVNVLVREIRFRLDQLQ